MPAAILLVVLLCRARDAPPPAATSTIWGRVTEQGTGRPVPRILVSLTTGDRMKTVDVLTDAEGRYQFTGVAPGKYGVLAHNDEHRSTYLTQWFGEAEPGDLIATQIHLNVDVAAGSSRNDVDIALTRALAIEGHIFDPMDAPMERVEVAVVRADGRRAFASSSVSDDTGAYRVYGLRPGRYRVCAQPRNRFGDEGATFVRTCHPASLTEADAGEIAVTSQDASNIDVRMMRAGVRSISGTVVDSSGAAVDAADVFVTALDPYGAGTSVRSQGGAFSVKGLAAGHYLVRASLGEQRPGDPNPPSRAPEASLVSVDLTTSEAADITIALSKAVRIAGTVAFEGTPLSPSAIGRLTVQASPPSSDMMFTFMSSAPVNADGRFELGGIYRVPLLVRVQNPPDGWLLKSVRYDGRDITYAATDLSVSPGVKPLELLLTDRVARPSAHVTDDKGAPVRCGLLMAPGDPNRWEAGSAIAMVQSADGITKLPPLLPGDYVMTALPLEDWALLARAGRMMLIEAAARVGTKVSVSAGDTQTIELKLTKLPDHR